MSPKAGEEVQITELENAILAVFIKNKLFSDEQIVNVLLPLIDKLEGKNK